MQTRLGGAYCHRFCLGGLETANMQIWNGVLHVIRLQRQITVKLSTFAHSHICTFALFKIV